MTDCKRTAKHVYVSVSEMKDTNELHSLTHSLISTQNDANAYMENLCHVANGIQMQWRNISDAFKKIPSKNERFKAFSGVFYRLYKPKKQSNLLQLKKHAEQRI